jgi:hypothetical protein
MRKRRADVSGSSALDFLPARRLARTSSAVLVLRGPPQAPKRRIARRRGLRTKGFALAREDGKDTLFQSDAPTVRTAKGTQDVRAERLAAALRDNLRRRKAQARGRRAEADNSGKIAGEVDS